MTKSAAQVGYVSPTRFRRDWDDSAITILDLSNRMLFPTSWSWGKPLGNGHPLGALVTTRAIADSFANGPEFFSTFGGSTLSCRIGKEVLDIVDDENLQANAKTQGDLLLNGLRKLQKKHACIGDVRGIGLFVGVELVTDRESRTAATEIAAFVSDRMREHRILLGREGPMDNILKIRPPLTVQADDIDMIISTLDNILSDQA